MQGISTGSISGHRLQELGLHYISGPLDRKATQVAPPDHPENDSLVFVSQSFSWIGKFQGILIAQKDHVPSVVEPSCLLFSTPHLREAMILVLPHFESKMLARDRIVSAKAHVDPTARVNANVTISPFAYIGANAIIGENAWIGPGAVIEHGASIGARTFIHAKAVIGYNCLIGEDCEIHANTTIGSDGFGFHSTKTGHTKIPQIGNVRIGNRVEIGANCSVDRATIGSTVIEEGCKLDNLCHIAHNCRLGAHGLYAGGFFAAGSATIGKFFVAGGNVAVTDHVTITDHVQLGGRSVVTKDIIKSGAYTGYPLQPVQDGLKTIANLRELTNMRKTLNRLERKD